MYSDERVKGLPSIRHNKVRNIISFITRENGNVLPFKTQGDSRSSGRVRALCVNTEEHKGPYRVTIYGRLPIGYDSFNLPHLISCPP